jgi:hypothetical protein
MKLIIKQYLSSLKERNELDAVLPDLLSQMGLHVFSRPGRGTRQDGVDVAAVGSISGGPEKVYLFSIKAGDLTRQSWNGDTVQSLRSSLDSIRDVYIPNRLPNEHKNKDIVICLCFGGDIQEQVRYDVEGYIKHNERTNLIFEEWDGDKLASLILTNFLQEDLMPKEARTYLRKSLALLDEPEVSYRNFSELIKYLSSKLKGDDRDCVLFIRQVNICLWIIFSWARDIGNLEAAYLSAELAVLHAWKAAKDYLDKTTNVAQSIKTTFYALVQIYRQVSNTYISEKIYPHVHKRHGLSVAIEASSDLDINLRLFDILGRLAMVGIWEYWELSLIKEKEGELYQNKLNVVKNTSSAITMFILNNPALMLPIKDDQAVDISIAMLLLFAEGESRKDIVGWLSGLMERADFAYLIKKHYPRTLNSYAELLEHPWDDEGYYQEVTNGSILFPMIALWAALLDEKDIYTQVQVIKDKYLSHCNFQLWYPDENSEECFYDDHDSHGAVLSNVCIERTMDEYLKQIFNECKQATYFNELSALKSGFWPLIAMGCRHYRLPVPVHFWEDSWDNALKISKA